MRDYIQQRQEMCATSSLIKYTFNTFIKLRTAALRKDLFL